MVLTCCTAVYYSLYRVSRTGKTKRYLGLGSFLEFLITCLFVNVILFEIIEVFFDFYTKYSPLAHGTCPGRAPPRPQPTATLLRPGVANALSL